MLSSFCVETLDVGYADLKFRTETRSNIESWPRYNILFISRIHTSPIVAPFLEGAAQLKGLMRTRQHFLRFALSQKMLFYPVFQQPDGFTSAYTDRNFTIPWLTSRSIDQFDYLTP